MTPETASSSCIFCAIARGDAPAAIVHEDEHTMSFIDLRQFHPGHVLVIPKQHLRDVRELQEPVSSALMAALARLTRAVALAFPHEGLSIWHSIGEAAYQEVPHLHLHIHPRRTGDGMFQVYPRSPSTPGVDVREEYAAAIRNQLQERT